MAAQSQAMAVATQSEFNQYTSYCLQVISYAGTVKHLLRQTLVSHATQENGTCAKGATYIDWIGRGLHFSDSVRESHASCWLPLGLPGMIEGNAKSRFSCICSFVMSYLNGTKFSGVRGSQQLRHAKAREDGG